MTGVWFSGVVLFGREFVYSNAGVEISKPVKPIDLISITSPKVPVRLHCKSAATCDGRLEVRKIPIFFGDQQRPAQVRF